MAPSPLSRAPPPPPTKQQMKSLNHSHEKTPKPKSVSPSRPNSFDRLVPKRPSRSIVSSLRLVVLGWSLCCLCSACPSRRGGLRFSVWSCYLVSLLSLVSPSLWSLRLVAPVSVIADISRSLWSLIPVKRLLDKGMDVNKSKGFAFIRYATPEQARKVLADLKDGTDTLYMGQKVLERLKNLGVEHIEEIYLPEIMVPLELEHQVSLIRDVSKKVFSEMGTSIGYKIGTMIEIPRADLLRTRVIIRDERMSLGSYLHVRKIATLTPNFKSLTAFA
ncbi:hypothetical protein Syun_030002 [Stephania yunnanensis]|uniref:PEP-utilising enzyme C-terminal domain-containing protein n=1 Tax=Stephania yunnanensis TaxID=152371 RepID=A0AAP0EE83_9MAGN